MKIIFLHFLKVWVGSLLAAGVLGVGILSIITMDHAHNRQSCFVPSEAGLGDMSPDSGNLCINYHLGILHNLSQAILVGMANFAVLWWITLTFCLNASWRLYNIIDLSYFRSRLRLRSRLGLVSFYRQIGCWLTLLEKKDYLYSTAAV